MFTRCLPAWFLLGLLLSSRLTYGAPRPFQRVITSPNGQITLTVSVTDSVRFSVRYVNQSLLEPSAIALTLANGRTLGVRAGTPKSRTRIIRDSILPLVVTKRRVIADHYTELSLDFGSAYGLDFRAYDDGVAYRFRTNLPDSITVQAEMARFTFSGTPTVYYPAVQPRAGMDRFHTSFEELYQIKPL